MKGYVVNIEKAARENASFRKVLYTAKHCQLVLMSLQPNEDIGEEVHTLDQFIRVETGSGEAVLGGVKHILEDGMALIIPTGTRHNLTNTSHDQPLKLYTLYAPPEHQDGIVRATKAEAEASEEHFDGTTTER